MGLIGFGNVGQGFVKVLHRNITYIRERYGFDVKLKYIVDPVKGSVYSKEGLNLGEIIDFVDRKGSLKHHPDSRDIDSFTAIHDGEIDVIVEVTPTNLVDGEPGYSHIKRSLEEGKHIITTNKGPIALYYKDLTRLAENRGLYLGFEGTVMSGTPLIKTIKHGVLQDIKKVRGILNGTTNFILTRMGEGYTFEVALKEAQRLGYAETDPTMDIDGYDLVAKATILANLITERGIKPEDIVRKSLREYLEKESYKDNLKYLVIIDPVQDQYLVSPEIIDHDDILTAVKGVNNGVVVETDLLKEIFIYGPGAGRLDTGYAILTDFMELMKTHMKIKK